MMQFPTKLIFKPPNLLQLGSHKLLVVLFNLLERCREKLLFHGLIGHTGLSLKVRFSPNSLSVIFSRKTYLANLS